MSYSKIVGYYLGYESQGDPKFQISSGPFASEALADEQARKTGSPENFTVVKIKPEFRYEKTVETRRLS